MDIYVYIMDIYIFEFEFEVVVVNEKRILLFINLDSSVDGTNLLHTQKTNCVKGDEGLQCVTRLR